MQSELQTQANQTGLQFDTAEINKINVFLNKKNAKTTKTPVSNQSNNSSSSFSSFSKDSENEHSAIDEAILKNLDID